MGFRYHRPNKIRSHRGRTFPRLTESLSQVVPVLVAALVCDVGATEPHTKKKSLIGIFDRLSTASFPTKRAVSLYLKIADAEGHYELEIRFVHLNSGTMVAKAEGKLEQSDRLASADLLIPFPPLQIGEPGRYEFQVWANSTFLGSTTIDVVGRSAK